MNNYKETVFNAETNETIIQDYKPEVIELLEKENKEAADKAAKLAAEAAAKEEARQALLDKLGITADEAKLLLG